MTHEILLQDAADELHGLQQEREVKQGRVRALVGDGNGNIDGPNGTPWILVRIGGDTSRLAQAYNGTPLMPSEGMSVILLVRYTEGRVDHYEVERMGGSEVYQNYHPGGLGGVTAHAISHEFRVDGGWDAVNVYERAFTSLRVNAQDTPDLTVQVAPGYYEIDNQLYFWIGGNSVAFTPPGSGVRYDVLTLDTSENLNIEVGALTLPPIAFSIPSGRVPIIAVRLAAGQTAITEDDLVDVRPFLSIGSGSGTPTGPAGGDLTGTYPNPTLAALTVDTAELVDGSVTNIKLATGQVVRAGTLAAMVATTPPDGVLWFATDDEGGRLYRGDGFIWFATGATVLHETPVMVASGASHAAGHVPDPGASSGTTKFLREDATWAVPAGSGGSDVGHEHGLDRYAASASQTVFDLSSLASQIELCSDNGSIIDPFTYTLSVDGSQVTMDSGITAGHIVTINYIILAI